MRATSLIDPEHPRITKGLLEAWFAEGLTYKQMAERFYDETGQTRTISAFSRSAGRHGLKSPYARQRWTQQLPWRVRTEHLMAYEARMLRLLGRREAGQEFIDPMDNQRLDSFLRELDEDNKVVHYDPETAQGFWCIPRESQDAGGYIRRPADPA